MYLCISYKRNFTLTARYTLLHSDYCLLTDRLKTRDLLYLKELFKPRNVSVAIVTMATNLDTLDDMSCQGNRPLFVLLSSDETTRSYLKQVQENFNVAPSI
jgi:hypothetical protein